MVNIISATPQHSTLTDAGLTRKQSVSREPTLAATEETKPVESGEESDVDEAGMDCRRGPCISS